MMQKWTFFLVMVLFIACNSSKKTPNTDANGSNALASTKCKTPGIVRDMTKLDGCQFLIELESGEKWLPTKMEDENFKLVDGQAVLFGYREVTDGMSACMAESKMIEVTCIKTITNEKDKPVVKKCWDLTDPMKATWMADIIQNEAPFRITKYNFRDGWAYMIFTKEKRLFYTCQGNDLCPAGEGFEDCINKYMKLISNPTVIYQNK